MEVEKKNEICCKHQKICSGCDRLGDVSTSEKHFSCRPPFFGMQVMTCFRGTGDCNRDWRRQFFCQGPKVD